MYATGKINERRQKKQANDQRVFFGAKNDGKKFIKPCGSEKNQKVIKNGIDKIIASTENIEDSQ